MKLTSVIAVLAIFAALVAVAIVVLSRSKKAGAGDVNLIGAIGQVDETLDPEGSVLVQGELWRARSSDGVAAPSHTRVRVVGFQDHFLLVEICD